MEKPLIGINVDIPKRRLECRGCPSVTLPPWVDCITRAGGIPVLMPPLDDAADIDRFLLNLQAFVVAGQKDLGPISDTPVVEDPFELRLMHAIARIGLPVLGIGVGMQAMNVSQGGDLRFVEHLVTRSRQHHHVHDPRHPLKTKSGSLIERVYAHSGSLVISAHEKAVNEVAASFRVSARCPDGVVEAIESKRDDWFAIGLQFQPDAAVTPGLGRRLFEEFIEEVVHRTDDVASVM